MTNHWRDIKNADVILINGANPAEAHPVGFQWFVKAKLDPTKGPGAGGGAKIVHADPRFTRTSALADTYLRIRTGTDVAYFGGLINYVLQNDLYHADYVKLHIVSVVQVVLEDVVDEPAEVGHVRPRADAQVRVGQGGGAREARVGVDDLRSAARTGPLRRVELRFHEPLEPDRVRLRRVRAVDEDDVGVLDVTPVVRHRSPSE